MKKDRHKIDYAELQPGYIRGIVHESFRKVCKLKHKKYLAKKKIERLKAKIRRENKKGLKE